MITFTVILVLYLMAVLAPSTLLDLIEAAYAVARFLGEVILIAAQTVIKALWFVLSIAAHAAARGICLGFTFLYFLAAELLRGDARDDEADFDDAAEDEDDLYQAALTLLGLPRDFTRADLDAAFKKAIRIAHPDAGGSVDQAQAVNTARDLLLRRMRTA